MVFRRIVGAALIAVAAANTAAAQARADFSEADNGRVVRLLSPVFTVALPVNAGTGYSWRFGNQFSRGVQLVSTAAEHAPTPPGYVGGAVSMRFTFRAVQLHGTLVMGLLPPGRGRQPVRTWRISFNSGYARPPQSGRYE